MRREGFHIIRDWLLKQVTWLYLVLLTDVDT